ncbi:hypothetical protein [Aerosakkonema funiforme]|uniref:hypothetical protein n=1 Tax=Aerosakkonema funiforme TaxID=1246630 RepID=UPI0035B8B424
MINSDNIKTEQIWHDLDEILADLNVKNLAKQHLESCNFKLRGYWDSKNEYYEEIIFVSPILAKLSSSSIGTTYTENSSSRWVKLRFLLKIDSSADGDNGVSDDEDDEIGDLILVLDENLQIVDENWIIDVESPFVIAKQKTDLQHFDIE